jgi:hypothetical protein
MNKRNMSNWSKKRSHHFAMVSMKYLFTALFVMMGIASAYGQHVDATNGPAGESTMMQSFTHSGPIVNELPPLPFKEEFSIEADPSKRKPTAVTKTAPAIPPVKPAEALKPVYVSTPQPDYDSTPSVASGSSKTVYVKSHTRKNGTVVQTHTRSAPGSKSGKR